MRGIFLRSIASLAMLAMAFGASGATIYSQTTTPTTLLGADLGGTGTIISQRFTLAAADIVRSITWRGVETSVENFTVSFYSDDGVGAVPGTLIGSVNIGVPFSSTDTGQDIGLSIFEFVADLGSGVSLSAGNIWISIVNDTSSGCCNDWAIAGTTGGFVIASSPNDAATWNSNANARELYFSLNNANAVPVPAAAWLFCSALGIVGFLRRKMM